MQKNESSKENGVEKPDKFNLFMNMNCVAFELLFTLPSMACDTLN